MVKLKAGEVLVTKNGHEFGVWQLPVKEVQQDLQLKGDK